MVRPKKNRIVSLNPDIGYFTPGDVPAADVDVIKLSVEEREALRLSDILDMSYEEAGKKMGVSRATFGRIIQRARKIIADALINRKAIHIKGGNYTVVNEKPTFICDKCSQRWEETRKKLGTERCPACKHEYFQRVS
ncbi:MAG TPA: hypothetical protein DCQ37_09055 [Desulfobacteraceae bacterium]|jgi:predicted DNA-binding protein (UPF0251 family)/DNA-directed RNA polymerase subunit RPC12/RpoP|nr:hypothetical protein [Desulfobacteraceae bacterium]